MPKDDFNSPIAPRTGANVSTSPHTLMFERLVSEMQSTLEEEVWFDATDWPGGFDWSNEADAVWEGLAEDAGMLAKFPARTHADRLLCRCAGLVLRAIRARTSADLENVLSRFASCLREQGRGHIHFLMKEAHDCVEQMGILAQTDDPNGPDSGLDPFGAV